MNIAQSVRQVKAAHPERYCTDPRCLWRVETRNGRKPCPKHMSEATAERMVVKAGNLEHASASVDERSGEGFVGGTTTVRCDKCDGTLVHCVECNRCTYWLRDGLCRRCDVD